jgi:acyl-CoA synthetase (NDP forming)
VGTILQVLTDDPAVGALVYLMTTQPQIDEMADEVLSLGGRAGKPVLLVLAAGSVADALRVRLRQARFVWHDRLDDALRVLRALADHALPPRAPPVVEAVVGLPDLPTDPRPLVAAAGVPVVDELLALDAAADAGARLGWPAVLKAQVRDLSHKSDRGGVRLDVRDRGAALQTVADFQVRFGDELQGVLVQPQVAGVAELIVGTVCDDALGPFVLVGAGGVFAVSVR